MIGTVVGTEEHEHGTAMEGVPMVSVEASASFLRHPERSVSRTFGEIPSRARFFSDPGAHAPGPRPVDAAGAVGISDGAGDSHSPLENVRARFPRAPTGPTATTRVSHATSKSNFNNSRAKAKERIGAEAP